MAKKANNKDPKVSVLEGDIALAQKNIGQACQLYEQAIYFDPNCKEAYLKYAQAYKSASPALAIEKLEQLKAVDPPIGNWRRYTIPAIVSAKLLKCMLSSSIRLLLRKMIC